MQIDTERFGVEMSSQSQWSFCDYNEDNLQSLPHIFGFLMKEFVRIFGDATMYSEACNVYNDPSANGPQLIMNTTPIEIRIRLKKFTLWAKLIFHLSHELCHYAIRQHKSDKGRVLSWFEEILCEAMSLYMLGYSAKHWKDCGLYSENNQYAKSIDKYLRDELARLPKGGLKACTTIDSLNEYNKICSQSDENRLGHREETIFVYNLLVKDPLLARCFLEYTKYIDDNRLTINFDKWKLDNKNNEMVLLLESTQPRIVE